MYLIKRFAKDGSVRKFDIALRIHDGRVVKFPGDRIKIVAWDLGRKIEMLVRAKMNGDCPSATLSTWIENMPVKLARRLIAFGLLEQRRRDQNRPINELIDQFCEAVASRRSNKRISAQKLCYIVRRICTGLQVAKFSDLTEERINKWLRDQIVKRGENKGRPLSARWRREFIVALKTFGNYLVESGTLLVNHLARMKAPGARDEPRRKRRGLTIQEVRRLMAHLNHVTPGDAESGQWGPRDRKMFYWTLIKTGIRLTESRNLKCFDLQLNRVPATVCVEAAYSKNKTIGRVPIPADLADALRDYVSSRPASAALFPMPPDEGVRQAFREDLQVAGIEHRNEKGEYVDVHALRHTAVTIWLTVDRLSTKDVQFMARLKSIRLVDTYSLYYEPDQFPHLDKSPRLVDGPDTEPPTTGPVTAQPSDIPPSNSAACTNVPGNGERLKRAG